ncbi:MAG: tryptophan--tRNA ligase [Acidiferrobacteraceae bacterium]|nr:tryptophan--tRNA ligase [Acidiferrobacteraceae bacterium]
MTESIERSTVLSGMRPTGRLHLGHYHGVLKNWVNLQTQHDSFFFVADWHALTTHYEEPSIMSANVWEMVVDWLAAGIDPDKATLFIQSRLPQHAELHLLLSMVTPLGWLERVPSFKDQQQRMTDRDLATYGFLGYPLLQSADILMYRANWVPVGEDQVPHVELTREIARRFNFIFGRDKDFDRKVEATLDRFDKNEASLLMKCRRSWLQDGKVEARKKAVDLVANSKNISNEDRERLIGYIDGTGRLILKEPEALLTEAARLPGLDGKKMSKSYNNAISMRDDPDRVAAAIRSMPTDPARKRRDDPGEPDKCPVWDLHQVYTENPVRDGLASGCRSASIGCVDCKKPLIEAIVEEQAFFRERAKTYEDDPKQVQQIIADGCAKAEVVAERTLQEVRSVVGMIYD